MPDPADSDRLTFGAMETDCLLAGRAEDALAVETRLDCVGRETLPQAVAEALAPALLAKSGVIRIARIAVEFDLLRERLDRGDLTRLWTARLVEAISAELYHEIGGNVACFDDYGDFAAAYLEHRFGEAAHPPWAFADFEALRHLSAGQAAVEIVRARPGYLSAVARRAAAHGPPDRLVERLGPPEIGEILRHTADAASLAESRAAILGVAADHSALAGDAGWRIWTGARRALSLALRILAQDEAPAPETALRAARVLAALSHLIEAQPHLAQGPATAAVFTQGALGRIAGEVGDEVRAVVAPFLADAEGRAALAELAAWLKDDPRQQAVAPDAEFETDARRRDETDVEPSRRRGRQEEETRGVASDTEAPRQDRHAAQDRLIASPIAGVALCLTTIRRLDIQRLLPPMGLREILVALIDEKLRPIALTDPLIAVLAPADPREPSPDWAAPPADLSSDLGDDERNEIAAATGADVWARLVAARFAAALPGLGGSSPGYLRRQFFHMGGAARIRPDAVQVTLDAVPLGVVLSMAGMTGWQGPLPWLGERELIVEIRGP